MTEAYPLHWPPGRQRSARPERARFDVSFVRARDGLIEEIRLLGARHPVLSTNIPLRRDGLPYAAQKEPEDTGVAVYFQHGDQSMCFSCDRWDRVRDNIRAVSKTIEAMRGIERWGTGEMVQAAFSGFAALPAPGHASPARWRETLGVGGSASLDEAEAAYRAAIKKAHPDVGGSPEAFHAVQTAISQARCELS